MEPTEYKVIVRYKEREFDGIPPHMRKDMTAEKALDIQQRWEYRAGCPAEVLYIPTY